MYRRLNVLRSTSWVTVFHQVVFLARAPSLEVDPMSTKEVLILPNPESKRRAAGRLGPPGTGPNGSGPAVCPMLDIVGTQLLAVAFGFLPLTADTRCCFVGVRNPGDGRLIVNPRVGH